MHFFAAAVVVAAAAVVVAVFVMRINVLQGDSANMQLLMGSRNILPTT